MFRIVCLLGCALAFMVSTVVLAQNTKSPTKGGAVKVAKDEKESLPAPLR
jgi:hypothetical protein